MNNYNPPPRTELSELGEFGLIDRLTGDVEIQSPTTIAGIGDDTAVLDFGPRQVLVTKDLLCEGVHFDLAYTPLKHLGYKAAVVSFSDIYAMNGQARQLLVGLSVSNRFSVEAIEELYEGLKLACRKYNVDLVGGDTTASASGLFISVTVLGDIEPGKAILRNGARPNELICVSGDLGAAYMGLLVLEREKRVFLANPGMQPELSGNDYVLQRQLKPEARRDICGLLGKSGIVPTAMIDISDGLASELLHICRQSGAGCAVYEDKIPIDPQTLMLCEEFSLIPSVAALNGGEDYELLFTVPVADYEKVKAIDSVTVIGHITQAEEGCHLISTDGRQIPLKAQGWDHLRK